MSSMMYNTPLTNTGQALSQYATVIIVLSDAFQAIVIQ
jgi:hypothetical protein